MPSETPLGRPLRSAWIETSPIPSHVVPWGYGTTHWPRMLRTEALPDCVGTNDVAALKVPRNDGPTGTELTPWTVWGPSIVV